MTYPIVTEADLERYEKAKTRLLGAWQLREIAPNGQRSKRVFTWTFTEDEIHAAFFEPDGVASWTVVELGTNSLKFTTGYNTAENYDRYYEVTFGDSVSSAVMKRATRKKYVPVLAPDGGIHIFPSYSVSPIVCEMERVDRVEGAESINDSP